jgi:hypothetical protein
MYNLVVKALGLNYFDTISNHLNSENIDHKITYDHSLRSKMHAMYAKKNVSDKVMEYWACYGYNENRLAISQLAETYFPQNEHACACNLVFPHTLIKYNPFKKGYVDSFVEYLNGYGLGDNYYKTFWDYFGKTNVFSTLTIPIESPLYYGRYKEIFQQNRIQGVVCYGKNLNTKVYSGYAETAKEMVYYIYGVGEHASTIEHMARIYFDNISPIRINNLPKNNFCIPYSEVVMGHVYGFDEILIRSGAKLITK